MTSENHSNGSWVCDVATKIAEHRAELMEKLAEVQHILVVLKEDQSHLSKISSSNEAICATLLEIKAGLLSAVLGKEIVPVGVTQTMLAEQRKSYITIIKTLSWAFAVIVLVLVGMKLSAPHWFV
jgi:hypothetical protein